MKRIAILASGSGTNAQRLIEHFKDHPQAEVVLVGCDDPEAGVIQRAWDLGVPVYLFGRAQLHDGGVHRELQAQRIDLIVLAGFLRLLPADMVRAWPGRIVNIHPALLPRHGGKGMYGERVHHAVIDAGEKESGITIHLVNERYDEGEHLLQVKCSVLPDDTPATLAQRIHGLEHEHYPRMVERLIASGLGSNASGASHLRPYSPGKPYTRMSDRKQSVLVALQRALLGEVSNQLRAVTVSFGEWTVHFDAFFEGDVKEDDRESMSIVETELMAVFPSSHTVTHTVQRSDYPEPIPKDRIWVFYRKEKSTE